MADTNLAISDVSLDAQAKQPEKRWSFLKRFVFLSPQITILTLVAVVLLIALIGLAVVVVAQVQASATVLTFNDTNRVFVQLQRETLRMAVLVAEPLDSFKADDVQLQADLIESRIGVLDFPTAQAALPPSVQDRARQIEQK